MTHAARWHAHRHSVGRGHLYQGRFRSFPIQQDDHFLSVSRYGERNALRSNLVAKAQDWRWGSLWARDDRSSSIARLLAPWPVERPGRWTTLVNRVETEEELAGLRRAIDRGRPYGDDRWSVAITDSGNDWHRHCFCPASRRSCRMRTETKQRAGCFTSRPVIDPENLGSAKAAGLRYVSRRGAGIARRRRGTGFDYLDPSGKRLRNRESLERIRALVIPPAWTDVWICPDARGHIQAIGLDKRGRTQYRYHARWREIRDGNKYERMVDFGKALPNIRRRVHRDLRQKGPPRTKVLATVVRLLETALIRVGNEQYTRENKSFGLTTMRSRHVEVTGASIHFEFRGKSGVNRVVELEDRRLAKIVRECQELPGHELFQYVDEEGDRHAIASEDVNEYLQATVGGGFTAKDFRTWAGTVLAAMALQEFERFDSEAQAKKNVVAAIESVARRLGNTKAVCRKCYVHPTVLNCYLDGSLVESLKKSVEGKIKSSLRTLRPEESAVLALLQERLAREAKSSRPAKA